MAKQFNVPPVIFPSGNNPNPNPTAQRNRPATAPFQPPRSTPSSLPFMSFDIGTAATSLPPPLYGASATVIGGGFEDEPPLLEELAGRNGNLDLYRCLSLIGYCMLPIVILSALSLFVPQGGVESKAIEDIKQAALVFLRLARFSAIYRVFQS
ncbi:hypothetical protein AgCh_001449 [Apium graveolens]